MLPTFDVPSGVQEKTQDVDPAAAAYVEPTKLNDKPPSEVREDFDDKDEDDISDPEEDYNDDGMADYSSIDDYDDDEEEDEDGERKNDIQEHIEKLKNVFRDPASDREKSEGGE